MRGMSFFGWGKKRGGGVGGKRESGKGEICDIIILIVLITNVIIIPEREEKCP